MRKTSESHYDVSGNLTAKLVFSVDETVADSDFVKAYENKLFLYFLSEFSSIADVSANGIYLKERKHRRPLTLSVTMRLIKLKKTYLVELVSCDVGTKKLYKSKTIHVFDKIGGELIYRGTRKKTNAEKLAAQDKI